MTDAQKPYNTGTALNKRLDSDFALKAAGLGVWQLNPATNAVNWDDRCRELFGLAQDTSLSYEKAIRLIHPDDRDRVNQAVQQLTDSPSEGTLDVTFRTIGADDGLLRWVRFIGRSDVNEAGAIYRFAGVAQDVTQDMIVRLQLEEREERYRTLLELAPVAIGTMRGEDLIIETANSRVLEILHKPASIIGRPWFEALPELVGQPAEAIIKDVYRTGEPFTVSEFGAKLERNGQLEQGYYSFSYLPMTENGRVTGIMQVAIDITDQVVARQAMQESEERFQAAVAAVQGILWTNDATGQMVGPQPGWSALTGQTEAAYQGYGWSDAVHPDDTQPTVDAWQEAVNERRTFVFEHRVRLNDGRWGLFSVRAIPLFNTDGSFREWVGVHTDITEQRGIIQALAESEARFRRLSEELDERVRQRTKELTQSNQDLQRSNQNLEQFAYIASHDLQEPLRKIQSFGDLLAAQYANELGPGLEHLTRMQSAASRMSTLIRDLLRYSRISTRQESETSVSLDLVLQQTLDNLSMVIAETNAHIEAGILPTVQGDASQLGQLFQNLLTNALKFRRSDPSGTLMPPLVRIRSEYVPATDLPTGIRPTRQAAAYYRIDVADNGVGFDDKYTDRIFQVFQRLHGKSEFTGTGIGLAICEKVALNHGGAITATSQPNQGATFRVYLPVQP